MLPTGDILTFGLTSLLVKFRSYLLLESSRSILSNAITVVLNILYSKTLRHSRENGNQWYNMACNWFQSNERVEYHADLQKDHAIISFWKMFLVVLRS